MSAWDTPSPTASARSTQRRRRGHPDGPAVRHNEHPPPTDGPAVRHDEHPPPSGHQGVPLGFGLPHAVDQQYTCLLEFTRLMRESLAVGRRALLPFQKGFIMSSNARRGLYSTVTRHEIGMKYVLTSWLNQDCVENFSQVNIRHLV